MLTLAGPITAPGLYEMEADEYRADPVPGGSLSASGASLLLPPSCPALYLYSRQHGSKPTRALDDGNLAHGVVLGVGTQPELIPADKLARNGAISTTEAKEFCEEARARGNVPVKADQWATITAMADALRLHPVAGRIFQQDGRAEQSMFWRDEQAGIVRRARLDWLPGGLTASGRLILADYKTARTAHPGDWRKAAAEHGYHRQHANYVAGAKALGLAEDVAFVFVVQEKTPPYLVSVIELDAEAVALGAAQMDHAARIFSRCVETGHWPDYTDGRVVSVSLPAYYLINAEQELESA